MPKYPHINVELVGQDGNAFVILGRVTNAMRRANISAHEINDFLTEAKSGDYDHLLQTVMEWVSTDEYLEEDDDSLWDDDDDYFDDDDDDDDW